jgi:uncharacterized protein YndB with AHSA1/START domain
MTATFTCSIELPAPPETVFDYFIDAELLVTWIGDYAVLDARPGGEFTLDIEGIPVRGRYLEVVPPTTVVVSWGHAGSETMPPNSTEVRFSLTPTAGGGTLVEVEHRNLPTEHVASHRVGWPMFMNRLLQASGAPPVDPHPRISGPTTGGG